MTSELGQLTGEELLLMAVLGDAETRASIDQELDRRALSGPPSRRSRWAQPVINPAARYSARLVA